jgi:hypothetical protein
MSETCWVKWVPYLAFPRARRKAQKDFADKLRDGLSIGRVLERVWVLGESLADFWVNIIDDPSQIVSFVGCI